MINETDVEAAVDASLAAVADQVTLQTAHEFVLRSTALYPDGTPHACKCECLVCDLEQQNANASSEKPKRHMKEAEDLINKLTQLVSRGHTLNLNHFFLGHYQTNGGQAIRLIFLHLRAWGYECWLDVDQDSVNVEAMIRGVISSSVFVHLITNRSLLRPYCLIEARAAMMLGKPCLVLREDDPRQAGYISFEDACQQCPEDLRNYLFHDSVFPVGSTPGGIGDEHLYGPHLMKTLRAAFAKTREGQSMRLIGEAPPCILLLQDMQHEVYGNGPWPVGVLDTAGRSNSTGDGGAGGSDGRHGADGGGGDGNGSGRDSGRRRDGGGGGRGGGGGGGSAMSSSYRLFLGHFFGHHQANAGQRTRRAATTAVSSTQLPPAHAAVSTGCAAMDPQSSVALRPCKQFHLFLSHKQQDANETAERCDREGIEVGTRGSVAELRAFVAQRGLQVDTSGDGRLKSVSQCMYREIVQACESQPAVLDATDGTDRGYQKNWNSANLNAEDELGRTTLIEAAAKCKGALRRPAPESMSIATEYVRMLQRAIQMVQLNKMGFVDADANQRALQAVPGDLTAAVALLRTKSSEHIVDRLQPPPHPGSTQLAEEVDSIPDRAILKGGMHILSEGRSSVLEEADVLERVLRLEPNQSKVFGKEWAVGGATTLVFYDVETTGVSNEDEVIELCMIAVDATELGSRQKLSLDDVRSMTVRCRPLRKTKFARATAVHGIRYEDLKEERTFSEQAAVILAFLDQPAKRVVMVAHNEAFDRRMLRNEFHRAGTALPSGVGHACTLKMFRDARKDGLIDVANLKLSTIFHRIFGKPLLGGHSARADVLGMMQMVEAIQHGSVAGISAWDVGPIQRLLRQCAQQEVSPGGGSAPPKPVEPSPPHIKVGNEPRS